MMTMDLKSLFEEYLERNMVFSEPDNLYDPVRYIMQLGGKRLRPVLLLAAATGYGTPVQQALPAALSIEMFHNFTLLHDDIMDRAPIRRGKPTVHNKWNVNTGILSGDVMLIKSYEYLHTYAPEVHKSILGIFNKTAREVCEGQQMDMDFESMACISKEDYLTMIRLKTAVLIAASLQIGAVIAGANQLEQNTLYELGINLGLAFQLQDDYLDTFGNEEVLGKKIGGDILEHKKTLLYVYAYSDANPEDKERIAALFHPDVSLQATELIREVKDIFLHYKVDKKVKNNIEEYIHKAKSHLKSLSWDPEARKLLSALIDKLAKRNH